MTLRVYMKIGDILITRNSNEEDNITPGYWNHAAMFVGNDRIVEAQLVPGSVIITDFDEFVNRYPLVKVFRFKGVSAEYGEKAAVEALKIVGSRYRKVASIFKWLRRNPRGENCVSVVRKAYRNVFGWDPRWKIPDHIVADPKLYEVVSLE